MVEDIGTTPKGAFFVKCRPQDADVIDLVRDVRRVFVGYPPWRRDAVYDPHKMSRCMIDLRTASDDWKSEVREDIQEKGYGRAMAFNRGLAKSIEPGWIVAIPRPSSGCCWLGEISGAFNVVENPEWKNRYLRLRRDEKLNCDDEKSHVGDVVQNWPVKQLKKVPFGLVPRWISYRFFDRSSAGKIKGFPSLKLNAYSTLKGMLNGGAPVDLTKPTRDLQEIERRLLTFVGPAAFEHLCVALLQLEQRNLIWWHTGGSGDGGADGLAYDATWRPTAMLQCKWYLAQSQASKLKGFSNGSGKLILAALVHDPIDLDVDGVVFWGRHEIAKLTLKHRRYLPTAISLNIQ